ncbi:hypothetical protein CCYA_CCYA19G4699 [Cyanidiococcus yangmingshanensis]|nr:hypothetical protein CCYA_CCYA19G4699 [Cyanidiococcus yangmingshanensis]
MSVGHSTTRDQNWVEREQPSPSSPAAGRVPVPHAVAARGDEAPLAGAPGPSVSSSPGAPQEAARNTLSLLRQRVRQLRRRRRSEELAHNDPSDSCEPSCLRSQPASDTLQVDSPPGLLTASAVVRSTTTSAISPCLQRAVGCFPKQSPGQRPSVVVETVATDASRSLKSPPAPGRRPADETPAERQWMNVFREVFGASPAALVPLEHRDCVFRVLRNALSNLDDACLRAVRERPTCPGAWRALLQPLEQVLVPESNSMDSHVSEDARLALLQLVQRVYERATRSVPVRGNRRNADYVQLWLEAVRVQIALTDRADAEEVRDTFRYLKAERIGEHDPRICEKWAAFERRLGNERKARKLEQEADARREAAEHFMRGTCFWLSASAGPDYALPEVVRSGEYNPSSHSVDAVSEDARYAASLLTVTTDAMELGPENERVRFKPATGMTVATGSTATLSTGFGLGQADDQAPTLVSWPRVEHAPVSNGPVESPSRARQPARDTDSVSAAYTETVQDRDPLTMVSSPRIRRDPAGVLELQWVPCKFATGVEPSAEASAASEEQVLPGPPALTHRSPPGMQTATASPEAVVEVPTSITRPNSGSSDVPHMEQLAPASDRGCNTTMRNAMGSLSSAQAPALAQAQTTHGMQNAPTPNDERRMKRPSSFQKVSSDAPAASTITATAMPQSASPMQQVATVVDAAEPSTVEPIVPNASATTKTTHRRPLQRLDVDKENAEPACVRESSPLLGLPPGLADTVVHVGGHPYIKLEIVGRGGSSKVFKVMCARTRKIYALKRVRIRKADRETFRSYCNEIALLQRLRGNDNIIQLIEAEIREHAGLIYLVMEYGEIDLARLLLRGAGRPMNANFLRLYWQQMLEAVHTIHEARIVHSDLKPANFLFVEGVLKLIDFGIAKAIQNDTTNIVRDSQVGTLNYMSPEAILDTGEAASLAADGQRSRAPPVAGPRTGSGRSDPAPASRRRYKLGRASDIWSLGCILYQMVYGRTPFSHLNVIQKLRCITDPAYEIAFPAVAGIQGMGSVASAAALVDTLCRCLQRDPAQRATIPELLSHSFLNPDVQLDTPKTVSSCEPNSEN